MTDSLRHKLKFSGSAPIAPFTAAKEAVAVSLQFGAPLPPAGLSLAHQQLLDALVSKNWQDSPLELSSSLVSLGDLSDADFASAIAALTSDAAAGSIHSNHNLVAGVLASTARIDDAAAADGWTCTDADALHALCLCSFDVAAVNASIRPHAAQLASVLDGLDVGDAAEQSELVARREALIARTLGRIDRETESERERMFVPPARAATSDVWSGGGIRSVRLADVGSSIIAAVVLFSLAIPVMSACRDKTRITQCGGNLRQIGMAMGQYANDFSGRMPTAAAGLGGSWWNVGQPGQSNSQNFFALASGEYIPVASLACAGNASCLQTLGASARDYSCRERIGYSMQVGRPGEALMLTGAKRTIVADRSPVTMRAIRNEMIDSQENSPNHGGRGQQLLDNTGSVVWATSPVDRTGDNVWLPRAAEAELVRTGRRWLAPMLGNEIPSTGDVLVGP